MRYSYGMSTTSLSLPLVYVQDGDLYRGSIPLARQIIWLTRSRNGGRRDWLTHKDSNLLAVTSYDMPRCFFTFSNPLPPIQYSAREDFLLVARTRVLFKS